MRAAITTSGAYKRLYAGNKIISTSVVAMWLRNNANSTEKNLRFGYVASKKIGPAVLRNRAKRLMRSLALELERDGLLSFGSFDIVLIARSAILHRDYSLLKREIIYVAHKIKENI